MFREFINEFEENITGLRDFVELIDPLLAEHHKKIETANVKNLEPLSIAIQRHFAEDEKEKQDLDDKFKEVFDGDIKVEIDDDKKISFNIKGDSTSLNEAFESMGKTQAQIQLLYKNSLISLLSSVEWYFSQILHFHFDKYPDNAGINKKSLTLEDLKTFETVRDAERYLVDQKIESILRGSFKDWVLVLKNDLNLKLKFLNNYYDDLTEIYQRRNLLVHNGGKVNSIYLSKISDSHKSEFKIDDKLTVEKEYLENAIDQFHLIFILIASELWQKLEPESEYRGKYLMDLGYDYLVKNNWTVSKTANEFLMTDEKMPVASRTAAQLNSWLCDKNKVGKEKALELYKDVDYSDKSLLFQVALNALKDEQEFCLKNFGQLLKSEDLLPEDLMTFPIFEEIRQEEKFKEFAKENDIMVEYNAK
ncbi:hypothetical protein [Maribacter ulvicola]|uniref:Uncharacterized protein n=1 Tax=Maribacter ulvicola TaxID=228959 RepID=A0A1N6PTC6_9FLAO|nr:hypothetical protein [Maribacter ulvicola]SIQ07532.1 hypothetical protein SAMN05421797_101586 [Maribacter ulvicola]